MFHREEIPGGDELTTLMAERAEVKAEEVRRAGRILGFEDVHFFGADDAVLLVDAETVKRLARLLRRIRPDIVLTHYPKEGDGLTNAHAIAGQTAVHAMGVAAGVDPDDSSPPTSVARTFFFGSGAASLRRSVWDSEGGYYNDVFVDITDVVDKKLAALDCLVSQGYGGAYARKRIETSDGAFGTAAGVAYAEGLHRGPGRDALLPAGIGVLHAGGALVGPREDGAVLLQGAGRIAPHDRYNDEGDPLRRTGNEE